jgi:hypothetical protein
MMKNAIKNLDEARVAAEIVSVLEPAALRVCCEDRDVIRYAVRANSFKLRTIVLDREALRRLPTDPQGAVKVEYLKRDLLRSATERAIYRYPRTASTRAAEIEPTVAAI